VEIARSMVSTPSADQRFPLFATWQQFRAAYGVTYAIDFILLSSAKLMVLDRMTEFSKLHGGGLKRRWARGQRIVMAAVVLLCVTGICGNVAAAVYQVQTPDIGAKRTLLLPATTLLLSMSTGIWLERGMNLPPPFRLCRCIAR